MRTRDDRRGSAWFVEVICYKLSAIHMTFEMGLFVTA